MTLPHQVNRQWNWHPVSAMESNSRALHLSTENLRPSRSWNISAIIVCRYQRVPTICMCYQGLCKLKTVCATNGTAMPSPHASLSSVVPSPLGFSCYTPYKAHRCKPPVPNCIPYFITFCIPCSTPLYSSRYPSLYYYCIPYCMFHCILLWIPFYIV